jgi:hypothetical protein
MVYSFLFNLIGVGLANLILFWSLGININLWDYFSVIFLISIVASIPAGVGLKEWAYIAYFAQPFSARIGQFGGTADLS